MSKKTSLNQTIEQTRKNKHYLLFVFGIVLVIVGLGCNLWQDLFSNTPSDENQIVEITSSVPNDEGTEQENQPEPSPSETAIAGEDGEITQGAPDTRTITPTRTSTRTKTSSPTITEETNFDNATVTPSKTKIPSSKTPTATNTRFFYTPTYTPSNTAIPPTESPTFTTTPEPTDTPCPPT